MIISNIKNNPIGPKNLAAALILLFVLALSPPPTHADNNEKETVPFKKFQIELFGGYAAFAPSDLNLYVIYDNRMQEFSYDSYLNQLQSDREIQSWSKNQSDERKRLKGAFPFGGRLKYYLDKKIALSLGFKYLSDRQGSDISIQYTRNEWDDRQYIENTAYTPYALFAEAYAPMLGIHFLTAIKAPLMFEGYIAGGPMFVECHYLSDWTYEWRIQGQGYNWLTFQSSGTLETRGSGTGIALELGGRLNYPFGKGLEIFLGGGYAYQVAKNVSGEGREIIGDNNTSWEGRWGIREERISAPWGEMELELPTNYWPNDPDDGKVRDFELDLSGFQLRVGLSFRF